MEFSSYTISETKTAFSLPLICPPPYNNKGFSRSGIKKLLKKKAFTLAETLITLTIIGVVAALTIPTLMTRYQNQQYVVGLKKAYSQLQNAVKMMPITEGCTVGDYECLDININYTHEPAPETQKKYIDLFAKQYNVEKICYEKNDSDCNWNKPANMFPAFRVADGTEVFVNSRSTFGITIDINGEKGPNEPGRDMFDLIVLINHTYNSSLNIPNGTVLPGGSSFFEATDAPFWSWKNNPNGCTPDKTGGWNVCAGRVLELDKIDY